MEPQLEGCGKSRQGGAQGALPRASMEPQLEGCGKLKSRKSLKGLSRLQWSRNLRVAESL